jgi:hypothetical protein
MKDIQQAVKDLRQYLGRPPWLSAIGVGEEDGQPLIVLYLTVPTKPHLPALDHGWEGYKVAFYEFGSFAPLGGWRE